MASGQTENYGLNQWAAEDAVLREEFNRDNAKISTELAGTGNCHIVRGTYMGNGLYDEPNPNTLVFDGIPLLLFVGGSNGTFFAIQGTHSATAHDGENPGNWLLLTWNGNRVSWYNSKTADRQLNQAGVVYYYIALLSKE